MIMTFDNDDVVFCCCCCSSSSSSSSVLLLLLLPTFLLFNDDDDVMDNYCTAVDRKKCYYSFIMHVVLSCIDGSTTTVVV